MRNWLIKFFFKLVKKFLFSNHFKPEKYRRGMDFFTSFLRNPRNIKYEIEMVDNMEGLWIRPKNIDNDSVILYLHGGGYCMGSIKSHKKLASRIARSAKTQCIIIQYRLAPEHPFPAAVDDGLAAYKWLLKKGFKAEKIAIGGDSAGGGLTIATLLKIRMEDIPQPLAGFCMSPWVDLEASSMEIPNNEKYDPVIDLESLKIWGKKYAGEEIRNPLASPIFGNFNGIAPLLVQVSTSEVLLYENRSFCKKALNDGVDIQLEEYNDMVHVFQTFGGFLPQADKAIDSIGKFILTKADQNKKRMAYEGAIAKIA